MRRLGVKTGQKRMKGQSEEADLVETPSTSSQTACLENGQMRTPAMGYNPWNAFHDKINETVMLQTADLLVKLGLVDAGYTYLVLDGQLISAQWPVA